MEYVLESIQTQEDDAIVKKYIDAMEQIRIIFPTIKDKYDYRHRGSEIDKILTDLEKASKKRFGINFRFFSTKAGLHVYLVPSKADNAMFNMSYTLYQMLEKYIELMKGKPNRDKVKTIRNDKGGKFIRKLVESYSAMSKDLNKAYESMKVDVDFEKAKIKKAPEGLTFAIGINFEFYFNQLDLTNEELVSGLFHEIGHAWNSIAYANTRHGSIVQLSETVVEGKMSEKEYVKAVGEIYRKEFKDTVEVIEYTNNRITYRDIDETDYFEKNNEQMADLFATRFGLGEYLASALAKMHGITVENDDDIKNDNRKKNTLKKFLSILAGIGTLIIFILSIVVLIMFSGTIFLLYYLLYLPVLLITYLFQGILYLFFGGQYRDTYNPSSPYDDLYTRIDKIKRDMLRQLRINKVSRKLERVYMDAIRKIDYILEHINNDMYFINYLNVWFKSGSKALGHANFNTYIERGMENELFRLSKEYKHLKGKR
jgi:hypothetical protein